MRRLAVAAVTVLALAAGAVLILPAGGSEAQPTGIEQAAGRPTPLLSLELLSTLGPVAQVKPERPRGRLGSEQTIPEPCFREGPGGPCVLVCTQFVASRRCDRFPSAADGCLRFVRASRPGCLDPHPLARPVHGPRRP